MMINNLNFIILNILKRHGTSMFVFLSFALANEWTDVFLVHSQCTFQALQHSKYVHTTRRSPVPF